MDINEFFRLVKKPAMISKDDIKQQNPGNTASVAEQELFENEQRTDS